MSIPVIVGAAAVTQHSTDPASSLDAAGLMVAACRRAADASGVPGLAGQAGLVAVPRGTWRYPDAGRLVAGALGAGQARTLCAEIGVLQTTVLSAAVEAVADGRCDVALVAGGEALDRRRVARRLGQRAAETTQPPEIVPDMLLVPAAGFRGEYEGEWGIEEPYVQYALIDSARRHRLGLAVAPHRRQIAELWAGFSEVAAVNPSAWERQPWSAEDLLDEGRRGNRMLAFPYSAKLVTQMHVDQAAAVLVCSATVAERAGIPRARWVYPVLAADCEVSVPVAERTAVGECPQWTLVAEAVAVALGAPVATVDYIDLYSCFPIAVSVQRDAFGLRDRAVLTVTGGMTFGGGPLNNAALLAAARIVELLQQGAGGSALVTAVSGLLTKQGALLLTSWEPDRPYRRADLTDQARPLVGRREVVANHTGRAVVEAATVVVPREGSREAVLLLRTPDGLGTIARSADAGVIAAIMGGSVVGRLVDVAGGVLAGSPAQAPASGSQGAAWS